MTTKNEETATARYIVGHVSTQLMLKTLFEIIATMAEPAPAGDVRTQRLDGLRAPESLSDIKATAEPAYSEERRHPGRVSIATPEAARGPSAAPRPVKRAAAGGSA